MRILNARNPNFIGAAMVPPVQNAGADNYGVASDTVLDDNSPFNQSTPYGASKVCAEGILLEPASDFSSRRSKVDA